MADLHQSRIDAVPIFNLAKAEGAVMIKCWKWAEHIDPQRQNSRDVPDAFEHIRPVLSNNRNLGEQYNAKMRHTITNLDRSRPKLHSHTQPLLLDKKF